MKIALVHYRAGLMDGVSLEMEKWKRVLEEMGHEVKIVAGNSGPGVDISLQQLSFDVSWNQELQKRFFGVSGKMTVDDVLEEIEKRKSAIHHVLVETLSDFDVIIPNNIWSLALSIPLGLALEDFARESEKVFIAHHHDFWWEREHLRKVSVPEFRQMLEEHFPPNLENIRHVVINSKAREELFRRRGIQSTVIPNVFDFSKAVSSDVKKEELRRYYGIPEGRVVALQATRITERKAIELSVGLVRTLMDISQEMVGKKLYDGRTYDGRTVLAFSGMCEGDSKEYENRIMGLAFELGVEVLNIYRDVKNGKLSFWDAYSIADFITYPSILEGWGNQLLEAIAAKKPIVLFEYEIFERDIKNSGIEYISLGREYGMKDGFVEVSPKRLDEAAEKVMEILFDESKYRAMVEKNFEIGRKYYSLERLREYLEKLLGG